MERTGTLFAIDHWGVRPDIVTTAKSLAGGMPLGAVTGRTDLMHLSHVRSLGGTYSGNPLACRAALAVHEILVEDDLLKRSLELGETLRKHFTALQERYELIGEVRGRGPMLALRNWSATERPRNLLGARRSN